VETANLVPALTLVVMASEHGWEAQREKTRHLVLDIIQNCGGRERTYKSGLIFAVAEGGASFWTKPRRCLRWKASRPGRRGD